MSRVIRRLDHEVHVMCEKALLNKCELVTLLVWFGLVLKHVLQWLLNHLFLKTNVKGGSPSMPHPPPLLLGRTMSLDPSGVGTVSSWLCICPTLSRKEARLVSLLASNHTINILYVGSLDRGSHGLWYPTSASPIQDQGQPRSRAHICGVGKLQEDCW